MAETYNILDYRALPVRLSAALCSGLKANSRIMMKFARQKTNLDTLLLALIVDKLSLILWTKTKDAEKGSNIPKSLFKALCDFNDDNSDDMEVFESAEDFETRRKQILKEVRDG